MTYIRNSTVVAEMLKKNHDCNKLKDDFEHIIQNVRNKEDVENRIKQIRARKEQTTSEYEKEKLEERLAKLTGGVAIIKVGAVTEVEMKEKKLRLEDALSSTKAATEEGIVVGGGSSYLACIKPLEELIENLSGDEKIGASLVLKAIQEPIKQIAKNSGTDSDKIIKEVLSKNDYSYGYDALNDKFVNIVRLFVMYCLFDEIFDICLLFKLELLSTKVFSSLFLSRLSKMVLLFFAGA